MLLYLSWVTTEIVLDLTMIQQRLFVFRGTEVPELDFTQ